MPRTFSFSVCAAIAVMVLLSVAASGQTSQEGKSVQPSASVPSVSPPITQKPISDLTAKELLRLRDYYQEQARKLHDDIDRAKGLNYDLNNYEKQSKNYQDPYLNARIAQTADSLGLVERDPTKNGMRTEAQQKGHKLEEELQAAESSRKDAESLLADRTDLETAQQKFKKTTSFTFAGIVGMVIVGFFVVAVVDEQVRREIFAGQAGIQFITLFSLVIAIILFGITGVLEGKELAALLGGLAGYILGRSGAPSSSASADQTKENSGNITKQT